MRFLHAADWLLGIVGQRKHKWSFRLSRSLLSKTELRKEFDRYWNDSACGFYLAERIESRFLFEIYVLGRIRKTCSGRMLAPSVLTKLEHRFSAQTSNLRRLKPSATILSPVQSSSSVPGSGVATTPEGLTVAE